MPQERMVTSMQGLPADRYMRQAGRLQVTGTRTSWQRALGERNNQVLVKPPRAASTAPTL